MEKKMLCLDRTFSTTRQITKQKPVIESQPEDKFETVLFLPEGEGRQGEGGLRTQGFFKTSLKDKPLITVITVVFNGEQFLEETILSVINQTYGNVEYIIIDGGSTDSTLEIIRKYEHAIDYWVSEKDKGIYDAMNKGIDLATGEWLNFMNADDVFFNHQVLGNMIPIFCKSECVLYSGSIQYDLGNVICPSMGKDTFLHNTIPHQGAFYSRVLFVSFRYDDKLRIMADYELNLLISQSNKEYLLSKDIIAQCRDGGVSRRLLLMSFKETCIIKFRNLSFIENLYFQPLFCIKFVLFLFRRIVSV
jgi:glycosyltransferase involved in cell wall biosynthesis